jgi:hypothetical protein
VSVSFSAGKVHKRGKLPSLGLMRFNTSNYGYWRAHYAQLSVPIEVAPHCELRVGPIVGGAPFRTFCRQGASGSHTLAHIMLEGKRGSERNKPTYTHYCSPYPVSPLQSFMITCFLFPNFNQWALQTAYNPHLPVVSLLYVHATSSFIRHQNSE